MPRDGAPSVWRVGSWSKAGGVLSEPAVRRQGESMRPGRRGLAGSGNGQNGQHGSGAPEHGATAGLVGAVALVSEARARLADARLAAGLDEKARAGLSRLFLDLSAALLPLEAAAARDMPAARALGEAERLDLERQVAEVLTPALRAASAPALQVVLLQVASLAADVLARLELLAAPRPRRSPAGGKPPTVPDRPSSPVANDAAEPALAEASPEAAPLQSQKPRRRPSGRPRLHLVTSQE